MREDHSPVCVNTLNDAVAWLFERTHVEDWLFDADAEPPLVVQLVCDMFWTRYPDLVRRMQHEWDAALRAPTVYSWRSRRSQLGRR